MSRHGGQDGLGRLESGLEFAIHHRAILFPIDFAEGLSDPSYGGVAHDDIDPTVGRKGLLEWMPDLIGLPDV